MCDEEKKKVGKKKVYFFFSTVNIYREKIKNEINFFFNFRWYMNFLFCIIIIIILLRNTYWGGKKKRKKKNLFFLPFSLFFLFLFYV